MKGIKKTLRDMDKPLLFLTVFMFVFGLLNIVTASSREAVLNTGESVYYYFFQQSKMLIIGVVLSIFILNINTKKYYKLAPLAFFGVLGLVLLLSFSGSEHRGAQNWLSLGGFSFQPSELAKPVIIVCLSLLFEMNYKKLRDKNNKHYDIIGYILIVGLFIPALVFLQKDFGTMFITVAIFGVMFLASPILKIEKLKTIGILCIVVVFGCLILIAKQGYILSNAQLARFDFIKPCSNYETGGYQVCNGFIAFNDGGLFGLGIGKSKQKYSYIPEPHTDSVFAIIGEEYGVLRCSLIFIAYALILKHILDISSKASTIRGRYMCLGVAVYIFMHILVNLGGLLGLMPLTGVPLPFLSYGGTFTICLMASLAVVQRVNIETRNKKIKV